LKPGDRWCLCAARWLEAHEQGMAPRVLLKGTHSRALEIVPLALLKKFAVDLMARRALTLQGSLQHKDTKRPRCAVPDCALGSARAQDGRMVEWPTTAIFRGALTPLDQIDANNVRSYARGVMPAFGPTRR
jgi:hypothetical protein